jgi:CRISPR/Cas system CSM-associated protein Csm2 small subunit
MKDFMIDTEGNFVMTKFNLALTSCNSEYVRQKIQIKLRAFLGEYFLDASIGMPWWDILEKGATKTLLEAKCKQKILEIDEVVSLEEFNFVYTAATRFVSITFRVLTDDEEKEIVEGSLNMSVNTNNTTLTEADINEMINQKMAEMNNVLTQTIANNQAALTQVLAASEHNLNQSITNVKETLEKTITEVQNTTDENDEIQVMGGRIIGEEE